MAHFLVAFRIDYDATYQDRYDSLIQRIQHIATSVVWDEPTSFCVFEADGTAESVCNDLYVYTKVNAAKDVLFVVEVTSGRYHAQGVKNVARLKAAAGG